MIDSISMLMQEECVTCLLDGQRRISDNTEFLAMVEKEMANRDPSDSAPYMAYKFNKLYEEIFHKQVSYEEIKHKYNAYVLALEEKILGIIEQHKDPLACSLAFARAGNFIDFAATGQVDDAAFLKLLEETTLSEDDMHTYTSFKRACENGKQFLLITDNCGEIVMDKLFVRKLKEAYPHLSITAMVRGGNIINDATIEDAREVGLDTVCKLITSGMPIAGTIPKYLSAEAKHALDTADIILAKGQGNYETLHGQGYPVFYTLLCKCDLFMRIFQKPRYTGIFIEEKELTL